MPQCEAECSPNTPRLNDLCPPPIGVRAVGPHAAGNPGGRRRAFGGGQGKRRGTRSTTTQQPGCSFQGPTMLPCGESRGRHRRFYTIALHPRIKGASARQTAAPPAPKTMRTLLNPRKFSGARKEAGAWAAVPSAGQKTVELATPCRV